MPSKNHLLSGDVLSLESKFSDGLRRTKRKRAGRRASSEMFFVSVCVPTIFSLMLSSGNAMRAISSLSSWSASSLRLQHVAAESTSSKLTTAAFLFPGSDRGKPTKKRSCNLLTLSTTKTRRVKMNSYNSNSYEENIRNADEFNLFG